MNKKLIIGVGATILFVVVAVWAYVAVLGSSEGASVPIVSEGVVVNGEGVVFSIVQAESEVRFSLDELLRGAPTTVVGVSDQVAGEIGLDLADPAGATIGPITINARTLETDQSRRNQAIRNTVLSTDDFEFITFRPTEISGLPDSVTVGETYTFQIVGELTITDVTLSETFEARVTIESESRLSGLVVTTINRDAYGLTIPSVPIVAEVAVDVLLELDFVAVAP